MDVAMGGVLSLVRVPLGAIGGDFGTAIAEVDDTCRVMGDRDGGGGGGARLRVSGDDEGEW